MNIGDRVRVMATGQYGTITDLRLGAATPDATVRLDGGLECMYAIGMLQVFPGMNRRNLAQMVPAMHPHFRIVRRNSAWHADLVEHIPTGDVRWIQDGSRDDDIRERFLDADPRWKPPEVA